ncbi:MAG: flippase-like domain-containing protein [Alphaproteobacteria bacterium]|nr:flippase-like domain-containing protein [Alphaproteobacteria bacterium]
MMAALDATASRSPAVKRWLISGAKLVVTLLLCWVIVSWIDWQAFLATLLNARYGLISIVFALSLVGVALSAWKWQILLQGHGIRFPLRSLIRWYFIAAFFNAFLPTNIGGDGYRLLKTYDNPKGRARAVGAILLERITGVLTLGFMGYLAALIIWFRIGNPLAGSLALIGTIGGFFGLLLLALIWRFGSSGWGWAGPLSRIKLLKTIAAKTLELIADWRGQTARLGAVMALSLGFHLLRLGFIWLLILALGTAVDPIELTMAVFAVEVAAMLPISIGGLGVMEGSFVYVMGAFGLDNEAGLASMLMLRVLTLLIGLFGALLYLGEGRAKRAAIGT